ncbi:MAG: hypothetical protein FJX76_19935 [Armatimonadetes bacterium]|nr:hypothetical protein [Armatimonadota bacterium]
MDPRSLASQFLRIGSRLALDPTDSKGFSIDVRRDRLGEYFHLRLSQRDVQVDAIDVRPLDCHLLLMVRQGAEKLKFLCGHDERRWFVAAVPDNGGIRSVDAAMEALKPLEVRLARNRDDRKRRKNATCVRQGEWLFMPSPELAVPDSQVRRNEALRRCNGKPHVADECWRFGGETVYVCTRYPNGVTEARYRKILAGKPEARSYNWGVMRRDPRVFVRGRVRHADHKTVVLTCWHRVLRNTEGQAALD